MSDDWLRLIPADPSWTPSPERAERAVAKLFSLAPDADRVEAEVYEEVTFIDQGSNFERLNCPACRAELTMEWWTERMDEAAVSSFSQLEATTPCCATATTLNEVSYDWPAGFARVEISALNPRRSWLDETELGQVADALGHPLRQVMAHY